MARLPYQEPTGDVADRLRQRRGGELTPLDGMLLNSPPIADGWNSLMGAVRSRSTLPADVRELAILRVAVVNRAAYEWREHVGLARHAGLSEEQVVFVRSGSGPSPLMPVQQVAYDVATELTRDATLSTATVDRARALLGDRGVSDLVLTVSAYNMVSRFLNALDVAEASTWEGDAWA